MPAVFWVLGLVMKRAGVIVHILEGWKNAVLWQEFICLAIAGAEFSLND